MATGKNTVENVITQMGHAVRLSDATAAQKALHDLRREMVVTAGQDNLMVSITELSALVNANLGYIAGYMPTEYGNKVLAMLDVEHPVFGKSLDATVDEALAAGMRLAEQLRETKLAEERRAKRAEKLAKGIDLPDVDTAINSADAKALLAAIRASKSAAATLAPIAEEDSAHGPLVAHVREVPKSALEKLIAPVVIVPEEDDDEDDDYYEDDELEDLGAKLAPPAPPTAEEIVRSERLAAERMDRLAATEGAGAF